MTIIKNVQIVQNVHFPQTVIWINWYIMIVNNVFNNVLTYFGIKIKMIKSV